MTEFTPDMQKDLRVFAHDVRNMLGGISNYAQLLEMVMDKNGLDEKESTQNILELVGKINELLVLHIDGLKV